MRPPLEVAPAGPVPAGTPQPLLDLINECWSRDRTARPTAVECRVRLEQIYSVLSEQKPDIFLSHTWVSKPLLSHVFKLLIRRGFTVWYDQKDMGFDLTESMRQGIANSKVVIACINEGYQTRPNCMYELREAAALKKTKPLVTLFIQSEPFKWVTQDVKDLCDITTKMFVDIGDIAEKKWSEEGADAGWWVLNVF